jgi:DNA-binding IscR family transcriptional regulator
MSEPSEISVAQIADAIEGQLYPMFCLEPTDHTCFADSRCGLQGFWGEVALAIDGVFQRTTVAISPAPPAQAGPTVHVGTSRG